MNGSFFKVGENLDPREKRENNILKSIIAVVIVVVILFLILFTGVLGGKEKKYPTSEMLTIVFDSDGGNEINPMVGPKGEKINLPTAEKENYTFSGWLDSNGNAVENPYTLNSNVTLKASYKRNDFTIIYIKFDLAGGKGKIEDQKITEGGYAMQPDTPVREGYVFDGWMLNGNRFDFNSPVYQDITLEADWLQDANYEFTVTYHMNSGRPKEETKVLFGTPVKRPKNPERMGYVFKGWYLNGELYDFNSPVFSSITLVAYWEKETPNSVTYSTVNFDTNGADNLVAPILQINGKPMQKPREPKKEGYVFDGWYYNDELWDFSKPVTEDMTLKAKWKVE